MKGLFVEPSSAQFVFPGGNAIPKEWWADERGVVALSTTFQEEHRTNFKRVLK